MSNTGQNSEEITTLLHDSFSKLQDGWLTLLRVEVDQSTDVNVRALKVLQEMGYEGVYITLFKDYVELTKLLRTHGVDTDKLSVIDGISQMYGVAEVNSPNVAYVNGPLSLDDIKEAIKKQVERMNADKKFVFLDSITTVLLYNSLEETLEFTQFLTKSFQEMKVVGIMVSLSRGFTNNELIESLSAMSQEVIVIGEDE